MTARHLAIAVSVVAAGIAAVLSADPSALGLSPVVVKWLGIVAAMLVVGQGFLPTVHGGEDPSA